MIAITSNTRGSTMTKSVSEMSGSELVVEFNRLAIAAGQKPVKRFGDRKSALRRISALKPKTNGAKAPKKTKAVKEDKRSKIGVEFNVRSGSLREKLLEALHAHYKHPVTKRDLLKSVYGSASEDNQGAILMVMKGIHFMIDKYKLPYKVVTGKNEKKETTFGLYPK